MEPRKKSVLMERLPYYAIGVAIGLVLVGLITRARNAAMGPPPTQSPSPSSETTDGNATPEGVSLNLDARDQSDTLALRPREFQRVSSALDDQLRHRRPPRLAHAHRG